MANYDQFAAAVREISGGKNIVLLDDLGLPSVYVAINRLKNSEIIKDGSENTHPAFLVGGVEKTRFFYSKYQNVVINGRAYSLSHRNPHVAIGFDKAREACEAKGAGFHLGTLAEWAAIVLLTRKAGTMPHGNNCYGKDYTHTYEKGQEALNDNAQTTVTFTGSGPSTWGHDHTQFGIQDLNGNVDEYLGGMRLKETEIQIIPYNNAALGSECDMSPTSTLWKAINNYGSIVFADAENTLKYDFVESRIRLTTNITGTGRIDGRFADMTLASGLTVPELAKALILYPDEPGGDYGAASWDMFRSQESLPAAGGNYFSVSRAGVFSMTFFSDTRSRGNYRVGFRSAYVEL